MIMIMIIIIIIIIIIITYLTTVNPSAEAVVNGHFSISWCKKLHRDI